MEDVEDENEERTEEIQAEASDMNNDHNNITILLNNSQNTQNSNDNTIQMMKKPKVTEASASKRVTLKKDLNRSEKHSSPADNNDIELEVDLIVVNEKKTGQSTESNENGQTSPNKKRLRLEVESLKNQPNESSPSAEKETTSPSVSMRTNSSQPTKSIEEIVSSSEALDTTSEDKYFALSILGTLRRLTPHKRALAKCHILSYLTEIEYGNSNSTT